MDPNENRKYSAPQRRTNRVICEAFIDLLKHKPMEKISVRELCEAADINRATFYRYYMDLFDLYDRIVDDYFDRLFTHTVQEHGDQSSGKEHLETLVLNALETIEAEKRLSDHLFNSSSSRFVRKLAGQISEVSIGHNPEDTSEDALKLRYKLDFLSGGIVAIVTRWLRDDCRTDKTMLARIVTQEIENTYH